MPDRPFADPRDGKPIMAKPNLTMAGRTAGSPDNAQGTHFLPDQRQRHLLPAQAAAPADGRLAPRIERLIARAREAKVRILDRRIDVPDGKRDFPAYLDSNRFLSNLPGTTILFPVVDLSQQYINGMMYLLTQPAGARPTIVDDRNFYRPAGVKRWVRTASSTRISRCRSARSGRCARRSRPTCCCRTCSWPPTRWASGLDPRLDLAPRAARRSEIPQDLRPDARLRLDDTEVANR